MEKVLVIELENEILFVWFIYRITTGCWPVRLKALLLYKWLSVAPVLGNGPNIVERAPFPPFTLCSASSLFCSLLPPSCSVAPWFCFPCSLASVAPWFWLLADSHAKSRNQPFMMIPRKCTHCQTCKKYQYCKKAQQLAKGQHYFCSSFKNVICKSSNPHFWPDISNAVAATMFNFRTQK